MFCTESRFRQKQQGEFSDHLLRESVFASQNRRCRRQYERPRGAGGGGGGEEGFHPLRVSLVRKAAYVQYPSKNL